MESNGDRTLVRLGECGVDGETTFHGMAAEGRTSFVLLMGDDHGWDETGYNGHPYLKTPVLDEMARTGLQLDRFYSELRVALRHEEA